MLLLFSYSNDMNRQFPLHRDPLECSPHRNTTHYRLVVTRDTLRVQTAVDREQ